MDENLVINEDWKIVELGITVDPSASSIPMMPETVDADTGISGMDGEVNLSTNYGPRNLEIVGYSDEGLNAHEKVEFKDKIARFLHKYKNKPFGLVITPYERMYYVKYSGALENETYPASVRVSIPLKSSRAFGYSTIEHVFKGEWEMTSNTVEPVGFVTEIQGPITNPLTISLNGVNMVYENTVEEGESLIINSKNMTVIKVTEDGNENGLKNYTGLFPRIVEGKNTMTVISGVADKSKVVTTWRDFTF